jgi:hypothetical protein
LITIDDIIWLERVVEKLAWKHSVLPSEVEELLAGNCRIFLKEKGKVEGEHSALKSERAVESLAIGLVDFVGRLVSEGDRRGGDPGGRVSRR